MFFPPLAADDEQQGQTQRFSSQKMSLHLHLQTVQLFWPMIQPLRPAECKTARNQNIPDSCDQQENRNFQKLLSLICDNQFYYFWHACLIYRHQTCSCTLPHRLFSVKPHKQGNRDKSSAPSVNLRVSNSRCQRNTGCPCRCIMIDDKDSTKANVCLRDSWPP